MKKIILAISVAAFMGEVYGSSPSHNPPFEEQEHNELAQGEDDYRSAGKRLREESEDEPAIKKAPYMSHLEEKVLELYAMDYWNRVGYIRENKDNLVQFTTDLSNELFNLRDHFDDIPWLPKASTIVGNLCLEYYPDDLDKAYEYYLAGSNAGDLEADLCIYYMLNSKLNSQESCVWLKKAVDQNYAPAQYQIGLLCWSRYLSSESNNLRIQRVIHWLTKAVDQDYAPAQFLLGEVYLKTNTEAIRKDYPEDHEKAFDLFTKAANKNYAPAYTQLARMYRYGQFVEKDYEKALYWYSREYKYHKTGDLLNYRGTYDLQKELNGLLIKHSREYGLLRSIDYGENNLSEQWRNVSSEEKNDFMELAILDGRARLFSDLENIDQTSDWNIRMLGKTGPQLHFEVVSHMLYHRETGFTLAFPNEFRVIPTLAPLYDKIDSYLSDLSRMENFLLQLPENPGFVISADTQIQVFQPTLSIPNRRTVGQNAITFINSELIENKYISLLPQMSSNYVSVGKENVQKTEELLDLLRFEGSQETSNRYQQVLDCLNEINIVFQHAKGFYPDFSDQQIVEAKRLNDKLKQFINVCDNKLRNYIKNGIEFRTKQYEEWKFENFGVS